MLHSVTPYNHHFLFDWLLFLFCKVFIFNGFLFDSKTDGYTFSLQVMLAFTLFNIRFYV